MKQNKFSELIYTETDVCDFVMQGNLDSLDGMIVDQSVQLDLIPDIVDPVPKLLAETLHDCTVSEWHARQQRNWHMPDEYRNLDIASYVLGLCNTDAELQRCGMELLLYQERDLFDLLKYLKYLVDVMTTNQIVWGVGRGSSVASYVLYKLGVHRIDSMFYDLNPEEFLR